VLLAARADVEVTEGMMGDSALTACVRNGDVDCTFVLVENKANVEHVTEDQDTAISLAAGLGYSKIMQILIDYGADPNAEAGGGESPLYLVSSRYESIPRMDAVFSLLCAGARQSPVCDQRDDPDAEPLQGLSARMFDVLYYLRVMEFVDSMDSQLRGILSCDVVVDTRVGRGVNGLYHEPLERILGYAGFKYSGGTVFNKWMDVVVDAPPTEQGQEGGSGHTQSTLTHLTPTHHKRVLYRRWRVYMYWSSLWRAELRREAKATGRDPDREELSGGVGPCAAPQGINLRNQAMSISYLA
jgi:hypothetical protein